MNDEPIKIDVSRIVPEGWRQVDTATETWQEGDRCLFNAAWRIDKSGGYWGTYPIIRRIAPPQPETVDVPIRINPDTTLCITNPNDDCRYSLPLAPCIVGLDWAFAGFVWEGHESRLKREYYKLSSDCEKITYATAVRFRRVKGAAS